MLPTPYPCLAMAEMPNVFVPATDPPSAYNAVNPDTVLLPGDTRYVDFSHWRGDERMADVMARSIEWANLAQPIPFVKQLFAGHRGSGKSSELLRLREKLEDERFFVVYLDAAAEMDMNDVSYTDVLLSVMYGLAKAAEEAGYILPTSSVDQLQSRLGQLVREDTATVSGEIKAEAKASAGGGILGFIKLLGSLTAQLRGSKEQKTQLRYTIEQQIRLFLEDLNDLIDSLQAQIRATNKAGLVVIVDSLDRIVLNKTSETSTTHNDLFIHHAAHLKAPRCHVVYTVPISLYFNQNLSTSYPAQPLLLPMIKVNERTGAPCEAALDALGQAVAQRMEIDALFENKDDVRTLCHASGGHLRDLMLLLRTALIHTEKRIGPSHVQRAVAELTNQYDRLVRDVDLEKLVAIHQEKRLPSDPEYAHLPYHLLVLEYRNGEPWADVHPAVQATRKFKEALQRASPLT